MARFLMIRGHSSVDVTVPVGSLLSPAVVCDHHSMFGLEIPATLDGTTVAFDVSPDGVVYSPLYNTSNAIVQITVAVSRCYELPTALAMWHSFKLRLGTNQLTTDTVLKVSRKA